MREPYFLDPDATLYHGHALDVLEELEDGAANAAVTSPPYLDMRPEYDSPELEEFGAIFRELKRVVAGPFLLNVGRRWQGGSEVLWWHDLLEEAARAGWQLWDTLVWLKVNPNPIQGRVVSNGHEYVFILGKHGASLNTDEIRAPYADGSIARLQRRWISSISVKGDGEERNGARRTEREENPAGARAPSYFVTSTGKEKGLEHPAPMALDAALYLVRLAAKPGEIVLDPFAGGATTLLAARMLGRQAIGIELEERFCRLSAERLQQLRLDPELVPVIR